MGVQKTYHFQRKKWESHFLDFLYDAFVCLCIVYVLNSAVKDMNNAPTSVRVSSVRDYRSSTFNTSPSSVNIVQSRYVDSRVFI